LDFSQQKACGRANDPQAWLADVLARLPDHTAKRIHEGLP
jgi:transposase IS66-like protein